MENGRLFLFGWGLGAGRLDWNASKRGKVASKGEEVASKGGEVASKGAKVASKSAKIANKGGEGANKGAKIARKPEKPRSISRFTIKLTGKHAFFFKKPYNT